MIKGRLERDCAFLLQNDVTNYSVQLVVERNRGNVLNDDLGPFSFLSADRSYLYHFCISDFTETYQGKSFIQKRLVSTPKEYYQEIQNFIKKYVLVQQISESDKSLGYLT